MLWVAKLLTNGYDLKYQLILEIIQIYLGLVPDDYWLQYEWRRLSV